MKKSMYTRDILKDLASKYIRGKTLDLGAGKSKYRKIIEAHSDEYVACDNFEAPHINVVCDAHSLQLEDASFDTVVCTMVLEHVEKPWVVASEIERVLKSGGKCIIAVPFLFPKHEDPGDYFRFTTSGLASLFPNCEKIEAEAFGGLSATIDSFFYTTFFDFYRKNHGFFRRNIYRVIHNIFALFDKVIPQSKAIYRSAYFVGRKR